MDSPEIIMVNIALECFCILVSILITIHLLTGEERKEKLNELFIKMLLLNIAVLICDMITWALTGYMQRWVRPILLAANFGVYSFGYCIVAVFTNYMVTYIGIRERISRKFLHVISILCGIAVLLVMVSQFNGMYYYFDNMNQYHRNGLYWLSQAYPIGMMLADTVVVMCYRRYLKRREVWALLSYQIFPVIAMLVQIFLFGITLLYIATTISMLIIYVTIQMEHSRKLKEQELELADAGIRIMLSQIQPHFLYNSLTAIRQLCEMDPRKAKLAITQFSKYLRINMDSLTSKVCIPFEAELEHVTNYLALEQMRFDDELCIQYEIETVDFELPPLTLQPLVENAVRYGTSKKEGGGTVIIRTKKLEKNVRIEVQDDGVGFTPGKKQNDGRSHLGIENVTNRIQTMCRGDVQISSEPGRGTVAVITIPRKGDNT